MNQLINTLRRVAEVIDANGLELYAVTVRGDVVILIESDFRKLFSGQQITGTRDGKWIVAKAEKFGFTFESTLYSPQFDENVPVSLTV